MAAALGKVLAAVLSPVGSFGIHRPWPRYWRLCSPWKLSQEAHRVELGIRLSLSSSMDSGVTLSPKGRFPVSALLDPCPARCRERGGVETNQAEKWEVRQPEQALTNKLSPRLRCLRHLEVSREQMVTRSPGYSPCWAPRHRGH